MGFMSYSLPVITVVRFTGIISDFIRQSSKFQGQEYCLFIAEVFSFDIFDMLVIAGFEQHRFKFKFIQNYKSL